MNRKRCLWCSSNSLQRNISPWLSVLLIKIWPFSCCMWQDSSQSPVFLLNAEFLLLDLTVFPHRISTFFLDLQIFSVLVASPVFVLQIYQFVSLENCIYSSFNLAGWSFMNLLFYHFNFFHHKFVVFLLPCKFCSIFFKGVVVVVVVFPHHKLRFLFFPLLNVCCFPSPVKGWWGSVVTLPGGRCEQFVNITEERGHAGFLNRYHRCIY